MIKSRKNPRLRYRIVELINDWTGNIEIVCINGRVPWDAIHIGDTVLCCEYKSAVLGVPPPTCIGIICKYNGQYQSGDRLVPPGYEESPFYTSHCRIVEWNLWYKLEYCTIDKLISTKHQKEKL